MPFCNQNGNFLKIGFLRKIAKNAFFSKNQFSQNLFKWCIIHQKLHKKHLQSVLKPFSIHIWCNRPKVINSSPTKFQMGITFDLQKIFEWFFVPEKAEILKILLMQNFFHFWCFFVTKTVNEQKCGFWPNWATHIETNGFPKFLRVNCAIFDIL